MLEKTLLLIKPDAIQKRKIGAILKIIENAEFDILELKMFLMERSMAEKLYAEHEGRPYYERLISFMTSGKIVAAILEREKAIDSLRELIGDTDPEQAEEGTIRQLYGDKVPRNAVHASDSSDSATEEIDIVFPGYNNS